MPKLQQKKYFGYTYPYFSTPEHVLSKAPLKNFGRNMQLIAKKVKRLSRTARRFKLLHSSNSSFTIAYISRISFALSVRRGTSIRDVLGLSSFTNRKVEIFTVLSQLFKFTFQRSKGVPCRRPPFYMMQEISLSSTNF